MGAISTLDLRKRIGNKRKFSEDENEEEFYSEPETKKVMSVVKKVKKEKKEKKKKKDKKSKKRDSSSPGVAVKTLREITPKRHSESKQKTTITETQCEKTRNSLLAKKYSVKSTL